MTTQNPNFNFDGTQGGGIACGSSTARTDASVLATTGVISGLDSIVTTQFDKTTDTTLANITGLTATLIAGKKYIFTANLTTTAGASGGMKVAIGGTATATTISYTATNWNGTTVNAKTTATVLGSSVGAATAVNTNVNITGAIVCNAAGTLTVQMAQNASDGTTCSVLVMSSFNVVRVN